MLAVICVNIMSHKVTDLTRPFLRWGDETVNVTSLDYIQCVLLQGLNKGVRVDISGWIHAFPHHVTPSKGNVSLDVVER